MFKTGQKIGAYRVVRLLGQGGMGDVYEVVHEQLGTHYALKAFACDYENADALQKKFFEEGRLLSKLNHPKIVRVFDLAVEPESQMPYFVMDLVLFEDGEAHTAEDVEKSDITENLVYMWFKDVAEALDYIHSQGIVHRDVKLTNLLLKPDFHVTMTDFGISRIFGGKIKKDVEAEKTVVTKTGRGTLVMGTEHYMAPEVAKGEEATPAADAYALGVMCFRMLTGMWYEPGSDALALLSNPKFKLRWKAVLPQLLSPHAHRRPKELYKLKEALKGNVASTPNPVPAAGRKPSAKVAPRKRFSPLRFLVSAVFFAAFVAGASWFCYQGFLRYDTDRKSEAERASAELKRQIAEQKESAQKIEAEQKRLAAELAARQKADEERVKAEKAARRKRDEESRRADEARVRIGRDENAPERKAEIVAPKPVAPKEDKFVLVEGDADKVKKDYGPIPDKTYTWLKGGRKELPQEVQFHLSNGAVIDLLPLKAATFYMSNDPENTRDGRTHHKVTITRPFWISKYLLTAAQCRDFAPNDYEDCRPIEKALEGTGYSVSRTMNRREIDAYCAFLSEKYASQLPKGYVFRLPTEAEWQCALDLEATKRMYEDKGDWGDNVVYSSSAGKKSMLELRKSKVLDKICEWFDDDSYGSYGGLTQDGSIFVGGRMKPYACGAYDMVLWLNMFLDAIGGDDRLERRRSYEDEEVDPLKWSPGADLYSSSWVAYEWEYWSARLLSMNDRRLVRIVLGPDLTAEYPNRPVAAQKAKPLRNRPVVMKPERWKPEKSPRKLNRERKYSFTMDNGATMEFCLCPAGEFDMSNVDGQAKRFHRVKLTKPYLISKYNVTAAQWRDYGKYDCEGVPRKLEEFFKDKIKKERWQVNIRRNYRQWCLFCEYLTERYRDVLPKGYVFRLPTEAELERAMVADKENILQMDWSRHDECKPQWSDALARYLDKKHFADIKHFDLGGFYRGCTIGGRTCPNGWGFCDMRMDIICLDTFLVDTRSTKDCLLASNWHSTDHGIPDRDLVYDETETDPIRWVGRMYERAVLRTNFTNRFIFLHRWKSMAHIVIGPDVISERRKIEEAPYPDEDFGGRFVGDMAKVVDMSSTLAHPANSPERHKLLLSRENTIVRSCDKDEDLRGCHTQKEKSPWVQIELDKPTELAGIQVDIFRQLIMARHLRIWVSDGGKEMKEVASEYRQLYRYRFDLRNKNIKAKYIRIGREPGFIDEYFALNKVLIYGKKNGQ